MAGVVSVSTSGEHSHLGGNGAPPKLKREPWQPSRPVRVVGRVVAWTVSMSILAPILSAVVAGSVWACVQIFRWVVAL